MVTRISSLWIVVLASGACIDPADRAGSAQSSLPSTTCEFEGLAPTETSFFPAGGEVLGSIVSNDESGNTLYVDFWSDSTLAVGSYRLGATEAERDYDTCTVCVLGVRATGDADTAFFATSGTLVVESLDTTSLRFVGSLSDATLIEISKRLDTGSVEIEGGRRWCIPSLGLEAPAFAR